MKQIVRFSISGFLGLIITAALFIAMLNLLTPQKFQASQADTNINFSFVKDVKAPEEKPIKKIIKPEQQQSKQTPAAPEMPMSSHSNSDLKIPTNFSVITGPNLLTQEKLNGINYSGLGDGNQSGVLKAAIPPIYPQKPLLTKTEGWVKLLIDVNEFGRVNSASVLNAKPARVFNAAAIRAVKKWKFHPKKVDGKAIPFQVTQTIEFKLDK